MPSWLSLGFQDSSSPGMGELSILHDYVITIMLRVIILISYIMCYLIFNSKYYKFLSEGTFIETVWSMVPAFLLVILVLPSIKVLYMVEDVKAPSLTFKIIAHQWYWSYVVPFYKNFSFLNFSFFSNSYEFDSLLEDFSFFQASPRLLSCSSDLLVPVNTSTRLMVTSTDVIHSFAVPSLGLKVDAIPGRVNQLFVNPSRLGWFYGQCSEICGSNHTFMPISLKVVRLGDYDFYSKSSLLDFIGESFLVSKVSL